jgi:hypothetical protein
MLVKNIPGAIHLALDGWASPNGGSFLGVVALFLDPEGAQPAPAQSEGNGLPRALRPPIKTIILDFIELKKAHTGEYLAEQLQGMLSAYNIEKKVRSIPSLAFPSIHLHRANYFTSGTRSRYR